MSKRHASTTSYEIGGVMRCCIESLKNYVAKHEEVHDGEEVMCEYGNDEHGFVLRGNIWKVRLFDAETQQRIHQ